ncbi:MAG: hypothetical protein HOK04_04500 [Verrucomicrobia bacterium]|nr:hypothetical protein [Verrucomicrobiota bacterium]
MGCQSETNPRSMVVTTASQGHKSIGSFHVVVRFLKATTITAALTLGTGHDTPLPPPASVGEDTGPELSAFSFELRRRLRYALLFRQALHFCKPRRREPVCSERS